MFLDTWLLLWPEYSWQLQQCPYIENIQLTFPFYISCKFSLLSEHFCFSPTWQWQGWCRLGRTNDKNNWEDCILAEIEPDILRNLGCMVIVVFYPAQWLRFLSRFTKQIKLLLVLWCSFEAKLVEMIISLRLSLFFYL